MGAEIFVKLPNGELVTLGVFIAQYDILEEMFQRLRASIDVYQMILDSSDGFQEETTRHLKELIRIMNNVAGEEYQEYLKNNPKSAEERVKEAILATGDKEL